MTGKFNNAVGPQVRAEKEGIGKVIPTLAVLFLGCGLQTATQYFAHNYNYHKALGPQIHLVYPPLGNHSMGF